MDLDLNEAASERRVAAARVARDLASEDDLATLLGVASHGLGELFDGECTIQLVVGPGAEVGGEPEWILGGPARRGGDGAFRAPEPRCGQ